MGELMIYDFAKGDGAKVLESETRVPGVVRLGVVTDADQPRLRLTYVPRAAAAGQADVVRRTDSPGFGPIVLLLRPAGLDGAPSELRLQVDAPQIGARLWLQVQDGGARVVQLALDRFDAAGRQTLGCRLGGRATSASLVGPISRPGRGTWDGATAESLCFPIQLVRLGIEVDNLSQPFELGLGRLLAVGDARMAASGLAAEPRGL